MDDESPDDILRRYGIRDEIKGSMTREEAAEKFKSMGYFVTLGDEKSAIDLYLSLDRENRSLLIEKTMELSIRRGMLGFLDLIRTDSPDIYNPVFVALETWKFGSECSRSISYAIATLAAQDNSTMKQAAIKMQEYFANTKTFPSKWYMLPKLEAYFKISRTKFWALLSYTFIDEESPDIQNFVAKCSMVESSVGYFSRRQFGIHSSNLTYPINPANVKIDAMTDEQALACCVDARNDFDQRLFEDNYRRPKINGEVDIDKIFMEVDGEAGSRLVMTPSIRHGFSHEFCLYLNDGGKPESVFTVKVTSLVLIPESMNGVQVTDAVLARFDGSLARPPGKPCCTGFVFVDRENDKVYAWTDYCRYQFPDSADDPFWSLNRRFAQDLQGRAFDLRADRFALYFFNCRCIVVQFGEESMGIRYAEWARGGDPNAIQVNRS